MGGSVAAIRTRLRFDNDASFALDEQAATAFAGYTNAAGWSFRAAVGALVDGELSGMSTHDLSPGIMGAISVARQWTFGDGEWFVTGSAALSIAAASTQQDGMTEDHRFTAGDLRIGAMAGRTFAKIWNPYVLARGFGGPVWWTIAGESVTGTDTHHYQLGAGLSVATAFGLTVLVDVAALGERGLSLGASWRL